MWVADYLTLEFPSPCGVLVLKMKPMLNGKEYSAEEFPSPCGVLVLKNFLHIMNHDRRIGVSVPLRGSGS